MPDPRESSNPRKHISAVDSYEQYKILFDADPYPAFIYDRETLRFLLVNQAAVDFYGYSIEEFRAITVVDIRPADSIEEFLQYVRHSPSLPTATRRIWRHQTKDGRVLHVEISAYDLEFNERPARLVRVVDVSDRLAAEESLRSTEARLRLQNHAIIEVTRRHATRPGDFAAAVRDVAETSARTLGADCGSIWELAESGQIDCIDSYDAATESHDTGAAIDESAMASLMAVLNEHDGISAGDAADDPRAAAFAKQRSASSLLASPVRHDGILAGFIAMESRGEPRHWTADEENFVGSMSDLVAMAHEASQRYRTEILLRERLAFENLVTSISTLFVRVTGEEIGNAIDAVLRSVGEFAKVDHTYVFTISEETQTAVQTNEWCAAGAQSRMQQFHELALSEFPYFTEQILQPQTIVVHSLADLPETATRELAVQQLLGVKSLLAVPIVCGNTRIGLLGCDSVHEERTWDGDTIALMQITAEILGNAILRNRVDEAMRKAEERYRLLFERNLAGVFRTTPEGRVLDSNAACARIFGFDSREDLIAVRATNLYFGDDSRARYLAQLREKGVLSNHEILMRRKDGSPIWVMENVSLVPAQDGGDEVIEGTLLDITEWKSSQELLRNSEENFRILVEQMRDGVVRVDANEVIEYANSRFGQIVGYEPHELVGRSVFDFLHQDDRSILEAKAASRFHGVSDRYEIRIRRKSGEIGWLEVGGSPVTDATASVVGSIGVITDVTQRKRADDALRDSEARYRLMADNSTDLIARLAPDGTFVYASPASRALLGFEPEELIGKNVEQFVFRDDLNAVQKCQNRVLTLALSSTVAYRMQRKDGKYIWFETTGRAVRDDDGNVTEIISVSRDVTERRLVEEQIEYRAYHDSLTGLPNRELFKDRLNVAIAHARRLKTHVAVLFLDLDHFKLVNDTFGHSVGDRLLQEVAERIAVSIREEDSVARMGGDEFTLLVSDLTHESDATKIARKLLEAVGKPMNIEGHELYITTSVGISMFPNDGEDAEALLKNADTAMYRAKEVGRNNYQLCTPSLTRRALNRLSLENSLRRALDRDEMLVYYQPQFRLDTGRIVGFEALVRWKHPEKGIIGPGEFIGIAEDSRLIVPLGEWVLETAAMQAKKWQTMHAAPLRIAVNLSPRQFQQKELGKTVERVLHASKLPASALELEITETTAMHSTHHTVATLRGLKELGVAIAIDDFGTGHSSLNYLKRFPIDSIKIDRSFVQDVFAGGSDAAIVSAVITLAKGLRLRTVAEGVETEEQLQFLKNHRCEEMQGYLYCKALPAAEIDRLIESGTHAKMKVHRNEVEN